MRTSYRWMLLRKDSGSIRRKQRARLEVSAERNEISSRRRDEWVGKDVSRRWWFASRYPARTHSRIVSAALPEYEDSVEKFSKSQVGVRSSTRRSVRAKALFTLAPEVASGDHATQQRNGGVVRIAELAIQRIKNRD